MGGGRPGGRRWGRARAAADLATWNAAGTRLTISEAGRARLRREARPGDLAFADQHRELAVVQGGAGPTLRNAAENPLAWMVRRRDRDGAPLLDAAALDAGERLRERSGGGSGKSGPSRVRLGGRRGTRLPTPTQPHITYTPPPA
ncbi:DUF6456 domain-containing protein, partial [Methylobacterium radiotolerans]|uniref:DUF6456 domain-containing protein n=1 Tax=Methylobacterium radiotolerans TaxID=31998 RepID=UPI001FD8A26B